MLVMSNTCMHVTDHVLSIRCEIVPGANEELQNIAADNFVNFVCWEIIYVHVIIML